MKPIAAVLLTCLLSLAGCASYRMGAVRKLDFKTIYIENFKSDVDEPALETLVTTTIIKEFQRDGSIEVTSREHADVILQGRISKYQMAPTRSSRENEKTPTESSLSISVDYTLTKKGQTAIWSKGSAAGSANFFIGSDLQSDKRQGVPLAAERIGKQIVSSLVEGW